MLKSNEALLGDALSTFVVAKTKLAKLVKRIDDQHDKDSEKIANLEDKINDSQRIKTNALKSMQKINSILE